MKQRLGTKRKEMFFCFLESVVLGENVVDLGCLLFHLKYLSFGSINLEEVQQGAPEKKKKSIGHPEVFHVLLQAAT
jgi:hypothetical protein